MMETSEQRTHQDIKSLFIGPCRMVAHLSKLIVSLCMIISITSMQTTGKVLLGNLEPHPLLKVVLFNLINSLGSTVLCSC